MSTISGSHTATIAADPAVVFDAITDIRRLPSWNARMTSVVEAPATLTHGAEWLVELHALGRTWRSRSTLEAIDRAERRFAYSSATDDGNPSRARWSCEVVDDQAGSKVTVRWDLRPATFWRKVLFGRVRARQLARDEVPASLAALTARLTSAPAPSTGIG